MIRGPFSCSDDEKFEGRDLPAWTSGAGAVTLGTVKPVGDTGLMGGTSQ
jgi:hypothetical protein